MRILAIDDDPMLLMVIIRMLEHAGFEVSLAANGKEGLARLEADEPYDVLLTDLFMPDVDGIELIREVRARYPKLRIVAMSGGGRTGDQSGLKVASFLGADATISKPFGISDLREILTEVMAT